MDNVAYERISPCVACVV